MGASSLHDPNELRFYISGNVTVHPSAAIGENVFLQADPNSHLMIGAGVSIGADTILHACQGTLDIGNNVTIGTRVLIVGAGVVCDGACIGSCSTLLFHIRVDQQCIIPPNSLIGDQSRMVELDMGDDSHHSASINSSTNSSTSDQTQYNKLSDSDSESVSISTQKTIVYGKASVEKLIKVMFPARQYDMNGGHGS